MQSITNLSSCWNRHPFSFILHRNVSVPFRCLKLIDSLQHDSGGVNQFCGPTMPQQCPCKKFKKNLNSNSLMRICTKFVSFVDRRWKNNVWVENAQPVEYSKAHILVLLLLTKIYTINTQNKKIWHFRVPHHRLYLQLPVCSLSSLCTIHQCNISKWEAAKNFQPKP